MEDINLYCKYYALFLLFYMLRFRKVRQTYIFLIIKKLIYKYYIGDYANVSKYLLLENQSNSFRDLTIRYRGILLFNDKIEQNNH